MNDNNNLPKWDKDQISAQKKINKRLSYRVIGALIIVLAIVIVAIVVSIASFNKQATTQKPATNASISKVQKYEQTKFSDNNAASISSIRIARATKVLLVELDNVDISSESSASNSFSQLADELQSIGTYDIAKNGVIFFSRNSDVNKLSFAVYYKQDHIESLNNNYSDYIGSGNYESLFNNADSYYLSDPFKNTNKKLSAITNSKSNNIIEQSLKLDLE